MNKVLGFALAAFVPFVSAAALLTPRPVTVTLPDDATAKTAIIAPAPPSGHADEDAGADDIYGNEVSDAVARYKFDATGGLYETHSPQTELPRLASPKS